MSEDKGSKGRDSGTVKTDPVKEYKIRDNKEDYIAENTSHKNEEEDEDIKKEKEIKEKQEKREDEEEETQKESVR